MATSESELEARIVAIRAARDSGVLIVRHGEEQTQFRSLKEMNEILADLEGDLATIQGKSRAKIRYVRQICKGL